MLPRLTTVVFAPAALAALGGCATDLPAGEQAIEVTLQGAPADWPATVSCAASNSLGTWSFQAPGSVRVKPSRSPLRVRCEAPTGSAIGADVRAAPAEAVKRGEASGAKVGGAVGIAAAAAAAPVAGPALAAAVVVGAVLRGREIGGAVQFLSTGRMVEYPPKLVLRVE